MVYITLTDLKPALGIALTDTTKDSILSFAINASVRLIYNETGRVFTLDNTATARVFTPCDYDPLIIVDDIGSESGLLVENGTFGSTTWITADSSTYEFEPINALAKGEPVTGVVRLSGWGSSRYSRVRVTAKWGWPSIPDEVFQACLLQATRLYKRKDSPGGIYGSADFGFSRISKADPDVIGLISHLQLPGFGA